MSHEITERADGTAEAAYAMVPAWHGLGTVVDHAMTSEEAIQLAHLDWEVEQYPLVARRARGEAILDIDVTGKVANVRTDCQRVLGLVSKQYTIVQNAEAFAFVDALHQDGIIKYESAGSLKGGRVVWLLARMPQEFEVAAGDRLQQFILFSTSHDGSQAVRCLPTSVRVVCWNTYSSATAGEPWGITIRHMGDLSARIDEARRAVMHVGRAFDDYHETAQRLTETTVDMERLEAYVNVLFPDEKGLNNWHRQHMRQAIIQAFSDGPQMVPSIRGTAWAAFNSVTQVVDHQSLYRARGTDGPAENRMISTVFGSNAALKRSALDLAVSAFTA